MHYFLLFISFRMHIPNIRLIYLNISRNRQYLLGSEQSTILLSPHVFILKLNTISWSQLQLQIFKSRILYDKLHYLYLFEIFNRNPKLKTVVSLFTDFFFM